MSKSLDNYIGIDEPADIMFEKAMKVPDHLLLDYYILTTDTLKPDAEAIIRRDIREAHLKYAFMITEMYHSRQAAENARQRYLQVAGGAAPERMPEFTVSGPEIMLCELLVQAGFCASNREARRSIAGRGVKINGVTVEDPMLKVTVREPLVLQFGKNRFIRIRSGDRV